MHAPLADVLALYRKEGVPSLGFSHHGEFELLVRESDGSLVTHIKEPNASTEAMRWIFYRSDNNASQLTVNSGSILLWQNTAPLNPFWTGDRVFVPGTFILGASYTYTPSTKTWLIQCTFGAGTTRTFQTVGWCYNTDSTFFGNARRFWNLQAATVLSQPVTQLSTQTLEVNYRVTYQR